MTSTTTTMRILQFHSCWPRAENCCLIAFW